MEFLKQMAIYAILIAAIWAAVVYLPRFRTLVVPAGNTEITGTEELKSYPLDITVTVPRLRLDDVVTYRLGDETSDIVRLAWVAGLPGDRIAIDPAGKLLVNDKPSARSPVLYSRAIGTAMPACGPLTVPADHFFVINTEGTTDSLGHGPLPAIALRGRVGGL